MKGDLKKNQHVVCRFMGKDNGDLIVGRVDSVRKDGRVVLENLLTGHVTIKKASVLVQRSVRVSKKVAHSVVEVFQKDGRVAAKHAAVAIARMRGPEPQLELPPPRDVVVNNVAELRAKYLASTEGDRAAFARSVWGDVLAIFGVA